MHKFPLIETYEDIRPYVEGNRNITVIDRGDYLNVCYNVLTPELFSGENGRYEREARGISFLKKDGRVIARPFHKFFNLNEREETQVHKLDFAKDHAVLEKLDGVMIFPVWFGDYFRFSTKRGITDFSLDAETYLVRDLTKAHYDWIASMAAKGCTPIFEYVGKHKIVLDYVKEELVLLAMRHMQTGEYVPLEEIDTPFRKVKSYGRLDMGINEFVDRIRREEGTEGVVLRFVDGEMIKIKSEWYVRIHKAKDFVSNPFKVMKAYFEGDLDDVIPMMDLETRRMLDENIKAFEGLVAAVTDAVNGQLAMVRLKKLDRKGYALEVDTLNSLKSYVFRNFDKGHVTYEDMLSDIAASIMNGGRSAFRKVIEIAEMQGYEFKWRSWDNGVVRF